MTSEAAARLLALANAKFSRAMVALQDAPTLRARDRHRRRAAQWGARVVDLQAEQDHAERRATFAKATVRRLPGLAFLDAE